MNEPHDPVRAYERTTSGASGGTFGGLGARGLDAAAQPEVVVDARSRLAFLRRVYGWMFGGVVATVMGAGIAVKAGIGEEMIGWGAGAKIFLVLAWIGGLYGVQRVRHVPTWNVVAFAAYGALTGVVLSSLIWVAIVLGEQTTGNAATYLLQAGGLTLAAFGGISAYAFFTRRDFSFLRGFLMVGTIVLLVALMIGFAVDSLGYHLWISVAGVLLFSGFVLYDTQKVMRTYPDGEHVAGAITLYLDFVNLFIYILRIVLLLMGGGRRD